MYRDFSIHNLLSWSIDPLANQLSNQSERCAHWVGFRTQQHESSPTSSNLCVVLCAPVSTSDLLLKGTSYYASVYLHLLHVCAAAIISNCVISGGTHCIGEQRYLPNE